MGRFYADFLARTGKRDKAFQINRRSLKISIENNLISEISRCNRALGALERQKNNHKEAGKYLDEALDIAKKIGMPAIEIKALIERGRLRLEIKDNKGAKEDLRSAIKLCERTGFKLYLPEAEEALREIH